jgi:hypothetical protein
MQVRVEPPFMTSVCNRCTNPLIEAASVQVWKGPKKKACNGLCVTAVFKRYGMVTLTIDGSDERLGRLFGSNTCCYHHRLILLATVARIVRQSVSALDLARHMHAGLAAA